MSSVNRPKGPPIIATSTERAAAGRGVCVNFSTGRLRLRKRKEAWFPNFPSADHSMGMSREVDMDPNTGFDEAIEADIKSAMRNVRHRRSRPQNLVAAPLQVSRECYRRNAS